jgi:hypothetical protein
LPLLARFDSLEDPPQMPRTDSELLLISWLQAIDAWILITEEIADLAEACVDERPQSAARVQALDDLHDGILLIKRLLEVSGQAIDCEAVRAACDELRSTISQTVPRVVGP